MFKTSSDRLNFIERTGSHATKEWATGRIDAIPEWAAEPEAYYNTIRDQYRVLNEQLRKTQDDLTVVNERLRTNMAFKEYEHLRQHKERLAERYHTLQGQASPFREMARAAEARAWATVFFLAARRLLSPEDFSVLQKETREILGRKESEISKGESELVAEQKEVRRARKQRNRRRVNFRRERGGSVLVWSDHGPETKFYRDELNKK